MRSITPKGDDEGEQAKLDVVFTATGFATSDVCYLDSSGSRYLGVGVEDGCNDRGGSDRRRGRLRSARDRLQMVRRGK